MNRNRDLLEIEQIVCSENCDGKRAVDSKTDERYCDTCFVVFPQTFSDRSKISSDELISRIEGYIDSDNIDLEDINVEEGFDRIDMFAGRVGVKPFVIERAKLLFIKNYNKAVEKDILNILPYAALEVAGIEFRSGVTRSVFYQETQFRFSRVQDSPSQSEFSNVVRMVEKTKGVKRTEEDPRDYVFRSVSMIFGRFTDELSIVRLGTKAIDILKTSNSKSQAQSLAGGAIYLAGIEEGMRMNQSEVAYTLGVSEQSVRKAYRDLSVSKLVSI